MVILKLGNEEVPCVFNFQFLIIYHFLIRILLWLLLTNLPSFDRILNNIIDILSNNLNNMRDFLYLLVVLVSPHLAKCLPCHTIKVNGTFLRHDSGLKALDCQRGAAQDKIVHYVHLLPVLFAVFLLQFFEKCAEDMGFALFF